MKTKLLEEIHRLIATATPEDQRTLFDSLRRQFPIHALEKEWNADAELILEAIHRAADLTKRGIRGVIAEAAFERDIVTPLEARGWKDETRPGNIPFDFLLRDQIGPVRIQVKMQRLEKGVPRHWRFGGKAASNFFVVETQKTRSGKDKSGEDTRPYRFGEFDILAVSLHPSTNNWRQFIYTVANWLIPRSGRADLIAVLQPVSLTPNVDWTDSYEKAVEWFRAGNRKAIADPCSMDRAAKVANKPLKKIKSKKKGAVARRKSSKPI